MTRDDTGKPKGQVMQLTITHSGDAAQPPCISYQYATSSSQSNKKLRVDVDVTAVQRSKLLQELSTVADGEGQQGSCTTFTLPCSVVVFSQWNCFTTTGAKQLSVEALCQVLQVATFLQDEPTAAFCCTLLTSSLRSGLMARSDSANSVITWDPCVWDSVSSITENLLALPEPDLQCIVSHFHLQEMLAAPVELLTQWLRHTEASGGVLDMHCLKASLGWEQAFVQLLSRLWRLLPGLEINDLVLPAAPPTTSNDKYSTAMDGILEQLRRAELPVVSSVTAIALCNTATPEHLNTFLTLLPNVKSLRGAEGFSCLYPYPALQGEQLDEKCKAAVNDVAGLLPQLQSLQELRVCFAPVGNERDQQAYTVVGSLQQCTSLTNLWLDIVNLQYKIPDTLEALPSALSTLQSFRLNVQLDTPFELARMRAQVAVLSGYSSLTSLSMYFCMCQQRPDDLFDALPIVEEILSVLGEVLQPLKLLRHLCLDTTRLRLSRQRRQCTPAAVVSFIDVVEQLNSLEVDGSLMYMLLPVVPSVSVVHSLRSSCDSDTQRMVADAHGMHSLDISTLSVLTGLTRLNLDEYVDDEPDVDLRLAALLKCLPDLRVFEITSGAEGDIETRSILPHVAAVPKLQKFSYDMCWGQSDCVGWKELAKDETILMADSLTHLTLRSDSTEHGFPGIVLEEDLHQFYSVLVRLSALRELKVDVLPTHSAIFLTYLAQLKDLEQLSFVVGSHVDGEYLDLLESDVEEVGAAIGSLTKLHLLELATISVTSTAIADTFAAHLTSLCELRSVDVTFNLAEGGAHMESSEDAMHASVARQCLGAYVPVTSAE